LSQSIERKSKANAKSGIKPAARSGARNVGELVGGILAPIIARRAGMTLDLMAAWPDLIGGPLGKSSRPDKILWPRRISDDDPFEPATLIVACEGPQAIFLQHELGTVLEKVNTFFGFQAIRRIKIEQKPVFAKTRSGDPIQPPELTKEEKDRLAELLSDIDDDALKTRLAELGRGIFLRQRNRR